MRVKLVFSDWQKPVGKSIYSTEEGCALSMGCLHSGTTFDATIDFDEDSEIDVSEALQSGATPVFYVACEHKPYTTCYPEYTPTAMMLILPSVDKNAGKE